MPEVSDSNYSAVVVIDNGPSCVSAELRDWLNERGMAYCMLSFRNVRR